MRPSTHHEQEPPERRGGNCAMMRRVEYKGETLCFHGDQIETQPGLNEAMTGLPTDDVTLIEGVQRYSVGILDGDEWSRVWAGRTVDLTDACSEWQPNDIRKD